MFIQVGNEKIHLDFNSGIRVYVYGPESYYYVQVNEFTNGDDVGKYVEGYVIAGNNFKFRKDFILPIEFFMDFEVSVFKFVDGVGLSQIFNHRFNDYGKYVKFIIETENLKECELWVSKIDEYQRRRNCNVLLFSAYHQYNKKYLSFFNPREITPYKTYRIGRFPKSSTDFRSLDGRVEGNIWFGHWKKFWSYQHPKMWKNITSEQIANDILGL